MGQTLKNEGICGVGQWCIPNSIEVCGNYYYCKTKVRTLPFQKELLFLLIFQYWGVLHFDIRTVNPCKSSLK